MKFSTWRCSITLNIFVIVFLFQLAACKTTVPVVETRSGNTPSEKREEEKKSSETFCEYRPSIVERLIVEFETPLSKIPALTKIAECSQSLSETHLLLLKKSFQKINISKSEIKSAWLVDALPNFPAVEGIASIGSGRYSRELKKFARQKGWIDNKGFYILLQIIFTKSYTRGNYSQIKDLLVAKEKTFKDQTEEAEFLGVRERKDIEEIARQFNTSSTDGKNLFIPAKVTVLSEGTPGTNLEIGAGIPGAKLEYHMLFTFKCKSVADLDKFRCGYPIFGAN